MPITRQQIVDVISGWKGMKEKDGSYKPIIDIYNSITPLPRGYKLKYTDDWGVGTASAAYHQAGASTMFPCECSCSVLVTKAQQMGLWIDQREYRPKIADVCVYDWQDDGSTDILTAPDGVGIVVSTNRKSKTFVVIEGNSHSEVSTRTMSINGKYIRGFISPIFEEDFVPIPDVDDSKVTVTDGEDKPEAPKEPPTVTVVVGSGTLAKVAAGSKMKLDMTPMYASPLTQSISAYKTGKYYIWSVDTINNRVRITNAKNNVGIKGQVTGWIDVEDAIRLIVGGPHQNNTATTPVYQVNAVYVVQLDDVPVREGPGTGYGLVGYAGLTANAKKYDKNKTGCLFGGMKVTCLEVKVIGSNVWMRVPSGWIPAYLDKRYYVK